MTKNLEININKVEINKEKIPDNLGINEKKVIKSKDYNINKENINKYDEIDNIPIKHSNLNFTQILEKE